MKETLLLNMDSLKKVCIKFYWLKCSFFCQKNKLFIITYWWELGQGIFSGSSWFLDTKQSVERVKSVENLTKFALLTIVSEGFMSWFCSSSLLSLLFNVTSDVKKTLAPGSFDVIVPGWNKWSIRWISQIPNTNTKYQNPKYFLLCKW